MAGDGAGPPHRPSDPAEREWRRRSRVAGWAWVVTIVGVLMMIGSIVPAMANAQGFRTGIVLGDAEVVPVFGMVLFVMGILVLLQEWTGLT